MKTIMEGQLAKDGCSIDRVVADIERRIQLHELTVQERIKRSDEKMSNREIHDRRDGIRALVKRIASRNLYKLLGEVVTSGTNMDSDTCERQINALMRGCRLMNSC